MIFDGSESTLAIDIAFWSISASTIVGAIAVVQLKDLFRAALFLIVSLLGVAGMFILLRAEFLAAIQVLIYIGAISILIIFAIMMTRDMDQGSPFNMLKFPAALISILFCSICIVVFLSTDWNLMEMALLDKTLDSTLIDGMSNVFTNTIPYIARLLIGNFIITFEIIGVLLLAVIIGALALVRE